MSATSRAALEAFSSAEAASAAGRRLTAQAASASSAGSGALNTCPKPPAPMQLRSLKPPVASASSCALSCCGLAASRCGALGAWPP
eukprot:1751001-Prymnesium_polylepis.1